MMEGRFPDARRVVKSTNTLASTTYKHVLVCNQNCSGIIRDTLAVSQTVTAAHEGSWKGFPTFLVRPEFGAEWLELLSLGANPEGGSGSNRNLAAHLSQRGF
jgi:hypothetical protein